MKEVRFKPKSFGAALLEEIRSANNPSNITEGVLDDLVSKISEVIPGTSSNLLKKAIKNELDAVEKQTLTPEEIKTVVEKAFKDFIVALYTEIRKTIGMSEGSLDNSLKVAIRNVFNRRSEFVKYTLD